MAMLFFVGCDKTGKSTLFRSVLKQTNKHICVDRFTACQYVYGNHFKKESPSLQYLRNVEKEMKSLGGIFVHVTADIEDVMERFINHNEKDIELDDIKKIMNDYEEYLQQTKLPILKINTSELTIEEATRVIIEVANWNDKYGQR